MKIAVVIPSRWASTRFPGKPLAAIAGRPMIEHVWRKAKTAEHVDRVIIATDDERIATAARTFGAEVEMTRADHASGSDRLAEVAGRGDMDAIINVQGDEPLIRTSDIDRLAELMRASPEVEVASLCHAISDEEAANPNRVKVALDADGNARAFSRKPLKGEGDNGPHLQHMGVYAYRRDTLLRFPALPVPPEERAENLEQLRLLVAGIGIRMLMTEPTGPGVDAPEDIARIEELMRR